MYHINNKMLRLCYYYFGIVATLLFSGQWSAANACDCRFDCYNLASSSAACNSCGGCIYSVNVWTEPISRYCRPSSFCWNSLPSPGSSGGGFGGGSGGGSSYNSGSGSSYNSGLLLLLLFVVPPIAMIWSAPAKPC